MVVDALLGVCRLYAASSCFAEDAKVTDEGNTYTGRDAIRDWKAKSSKKYTYTVAPFAIEETGGKVVVTAHVVGNFPGSPVDLRYFSSQSRARCTFALTSHRWQRQSSSQRLRVRSPSTTRSYPTRNSDQACGPCREMHDIARFSFVLAKVHSYSLLFLVVPCLDPSRALITQYPQSVWDQPSDKNPTTRAKGAVICSGSGKSP